MTEVLQGATAADGRREMNRFADLMAAQGLAALFLRELIRLRQPGDAQLEEWKEFAMANGPSGAAMVGLPINGDMMRIAAKRATDTISDCFLKAVR